MHIVVIGAGKMGTAVADVLSREGHDVVMIDKNEDVVESLINQLDIQGVVGNGTKLDILDEAGAKKAYLVISATGSDEINILSCLIARRMGARHCIARVRNTDYSDQYSFMRGELGLSLLVNPDYDTASEIFRILRFPSASKVETFAKGKADLVELKLKANDPLQGRALSELSSDQDRRILICAVQRGEEVFIPDGSFVLRGGDKIYVTGNRAGLSSFLKSTGLLKTKSKRVMLIGGGRISYYLTRQLCDAGMKVKVIERDPERCRYLSDALPAAEIVCGDGADQGVLAEEGIASTDALVTLTDIDEENAILSMYGEKLGIKTNITKLSRPALGGVLDAVSNASVVVPQDTTAGLVLQYIRAKENSASSSRIKTLYRFVDNRVEAAEFEVQPTAGFVEIPLKDLQMEKNTLIACIIRKYKMRIPGGEDVIKAGDRVVVVSTGRIPDLDAAFRK